MTLALSGACTMRSSCQMRRRTQVLYGLFHIPCEEEDPTSFKIDFALSEISSHPHHIRQDPSLMRSQL
jgi:hypothetical protein